MSQYVGVDGGGEGGVDGSTVQSRMAGRVCREHQMPPPPHPPGASPKITETLVKRERGSSVDEPSVLRTGRVSFLCLTGPGLHGGGGGGGAGPGQALFLKER